MTARSSGSSTEAGQNCDRVIPTLSVGDVTEAIEWYTSVLGFTEGWRWGEPPTHASVALGMAELHLSATDPDPGNGWLYFSIEDVDALHARLDDTGAEVLHPPQDQEWGMREMAIRDLVGNHLTFGTPTIAREPKLPVAREELMVRLERRLVALLRDLAEVKGFSLSELLEETLLHTFEPVDAGGVASPHTRSQLEAIAELKEKHGIDYDVHASYRFSEEA